MFTSMSAMARSSSLVFVRCVRHARATAPPRGSAPATRVPSAEIPIARARARDRADRVREAERGAGLVAHDEMRRADALPLGRTADALAGADACCPRGDALRVEHARGP